VTRRLVALAALAASGCSLLFDPSKAPPRCPDTPPANPAELVATVGPTAALEWTWPGVDGVAGYKLCTSVPGAAEQCRDVAPPSACDAGTCRVRDEGLAIAVRVSGRVQSVDECGLEGTTTSAPSTSATPLSTTTMEGWVLQQDNCTTAAGGVTGGLVSLDQTGPSCVTAFVTGDELWSDFTLEADVRVSPVSGDGIAAGLAVHANAAGHRTMLVAYPSTSSAVAPAQVRVRNGARNPVVATSIRPLVDGAFTHMRLTSRQGVLRWEAGPAGAVQELMRWPDTGLHAGRLGVGAVGPGRIEVQNLVVSTAARAPADAPSTFSLDLADGGWATKTRLRGVAALSTLPCPALGDDCGGACLPPANATCARFERVGLGYTLLGFDLPPGLDVRQPWDVSLRFALAPDAGAVVVLDSSSGWVLATNATDTGGLGASWMLDGGFSSGKWHTAQWRFEPDAGRFGVHLDGRPVALSKTTFPPADEDGFLGAFTLGSFLNASALYVQDVQVAPAP